MSKELPFLLSYSDLLKPINEVDCSESKTEEPEQRLSTAFASQEQANVTQRDEPIDISLEQNSDNLIQLSVAGVENSRKQPIPPEVGPEEFQPSQSSSPSRMPHYNPARASSRVEDSDDTEDESEELELSKTPRFTRIPVINSPADLVKLVNPRSASREDDTSDYLLSLLDEDSSSESGKTSSIEENLTAAMDRDFLEERQRLLTTLADRLASRDDRIDKFREYENEDINRWFEKLEMQLE